MNDFKDQLTGSTWDSGFVGRVFQVMCPWTSHNCHSMCAAWRDKRVTSLDHNDLWSRTDGHSEGTCILLMLEIPARDVD